MLDAAIHRLIRSLGGAVRPGRLCVVNYHRILATHDPLLESEPDVATFRWQMELLSRCFTVLPLQEAVQLIGTTHLPPRAVSITFDDGYRSVHDLALPILDQFKLPATVFVTSGFVGGGAMWNDRIIEAVGKLPPTQLDLRDVAMGCHSLAGLEQRRHTVARLTAAAKYLPPAARLQLCQRLESLLGEDSGQGLMLTRAMLVQLARSGIDIGAHTVTHPILTSLDDDAARAEIEGGKKELEAITGTPVTLFAYPNGKSGADFDQRHTRMVREAGFIAAFTTSPGAICRTPDRYQLPRSRPWDRTALMFGLRLLRWLACDLHPNAPQRQSEKKVLLTAFHFPPQAASSGIQRTLSFSRHLGSSGWQPIVLSARPIAYDEKNSSQLASIPAGLVVRRGFALDAKRHLGIRGRYPEVFALPDRWASWWLAAVPLGLVLARTHRPAVLWSTFPIATSHLIALTLHRLTGLPWVADFRDPMLQPSYPVSGAQRKFFGWIERQTITRCSFAVFTTRSALESYVRRYPALPSFKFSVIENGYDEEGFAAQPATRQPNQPLTLLHSGVLYDHGRDPTAFFQALAALHAQGAIGSNDLKVVLRAPGEAARISALVDRHGVGEFVTVAPPLPYRAALAEMLEADALIVFQGAPFNTQIPAKIYEYFRARRPILGLVDTAGETCSVLRAAGFDCIAAMDDSSAIAATIVRLLGQIRTGRAHAASSELIAASSRSHRAGQLADILTRAARNGG